MKKFIVIQIIISALVLLSARCKSDDGVTKYRLPKGYSGWVFLILTDEKEKIRTLQEYVSISEDGFGYRLYGTGDMKLYDHQGMEVSDQVKLIGKATLEHNGKEYDLFEFYVPDAKTKALGEDIWYNKNPLLDSLRFQKTEQRRIILKKYFP